MVRQLIQCANKIKLWLDLKIHLLQNILKVEAKGEKVKYLKPNSAEQKNLNKLCGIFSNYAGWEK